MLFSRFPYLYHCAECGAKVKVKASTGKVTRTCNHVTATINAPRRSLLTGDGTMNGVPYTMRVEWHVRKFLTWATGRCI
jgi:hypothetical protein